MKIDFQNKIAVVTGGAMGIGAATSVTLSELGAQVAVLDRDREQGARMAADLAREGSAASFHFCNVEDAASVQAAVDDAARGLGTSRIRRRVADGPRDGRRRGAVHRADRDRKSVV